MGRKDNSHHIEMKPPILVCSPLVKFPWLKCMTAQDVEFQENNQAIRPLAAIVFPSKFPINGLLKDVCRTLAQQGHDLAGVLQSVSDTAGQTNKNVSLTSLRSGWETPVLQERGQYASGCRLDPQAITDVAGHVTADLARGADLLVINRFGRAESEGYGLRQVLEQAVSSGIPVLLAVREDYVPALEDFAGELGELLPPDRKAVLEWSEAVFGAEQELV